MFKFLKNFRTNFRLSRDSLATKAQTVVIRDCPRCGKTQSVTVESEAWNVYQLGALVQEAFPDLNPSEREVLLSGMCNPCWDECWDEMTSA